MAWSQDRSERLEKLWHAGKSASEIAEEIGGVTRNMVLGRARRMGLPSRPSPIIKREAAE